MSKNTFTFNFNDKNKLKLDIAGEVFYVDTTDIEMIKEIDKFAHEAAKIANKGEKEGVEALEEVISYCVKFVDTILGDGATKKIFKDRKISLFDLLDLIEFLTNRISEDRADKLKNYINKF